MKALKTVLLAALTAFVVTGCGLLDKKADPNYTTQLQAYKEAVQAKKEVEVEKAKAPRMVQVLSIKGKNGEPMIMSGVAEIAVNLPVELFDKTAGAEASMDKLAATMPSLPVEQPSFLEKLTLAIVDRGLAPGIMMWGTVTQAKEQTKQAESTNGMWRDIILGVSARPTPNSYTYTNSYNTGDNQGQGSGNQRDNSAGNYGTGSGDNRDNPDHSINSSQNSCRPIPPATTC